MPTAWEDWANRLIIGPRAVVQETIQGEYANQREKRRLAAEAAERQDRVRQEATEWDRRQVITHQAGRENTQFNITEQARVNEANRVATEQREREERGRLMREFVRLSPFPAAGVGVEPGMAPHPAEILQHKGGRELYQHMTPPSKEPTPKSLIQRDPTKPLVHPVTGEEVQPATADKEPKTPTMWGEIKGEQDLLEIPEAQRTPAQVARLARVTQGLQRYQAVQGGVAFQRGLEGEAGKRSNPIQRLGEWLNPLHFVDSRIPLNPPFGTTETEAQGKYTRIVDRGDLDNLAGLDAMPGVLQPLKELTDQVITAKTKLQLTTQGMRGMGAAIAQWVPGVTSYVQAEKQYLETRKAFISNLARALGGEKGVLTNADREVVADSLPSFSDTVKLKDAKWAVINSLVASARQAKLKWMGLGVPVSTEYLQTKADMLKKLKALTPTTTTGGKPTGEVNVPR